MALIQEKPLKTPDPNNPQIKEYTDAIERGKDALHILPTSDGWKIKKIGGTDFGIFDTQEEAVLQARQLLLNGTSSEVITHGSDSLISERFSSSEGVSSPETKRGFLSCWGWLK